MDYSSLLKNYKFSLTDSEISQSLSGANELAEKNMNAEVMSKCLSCLDLTSLGVSDSAQSITEFATKVAMFHTQFRSLPSVASVCVYPAFVDAVGLALGNSQVAITSVAAGFPSSQTFLEVKMLETAMAVENGADEIDVVISLGEFLSGDYDAMASELEMIKSEVGEDVILKVIIESGELSSAENIYNASMLAMLSGCDFIKTSTGKTPVSATPEAVVVMCEAIKDFYKSTGKAVGLKVAGGVKSSEDAVMYYSIVESILGSEWCDSSRFRIGASSLANDLLSKIQGEQVSYF